MPQSNYSALDTQPLATFLLEFVNFQSYKVFLKEVIATGSIDSYVEKFMWEDSIDIEKVSLYIR